MINSADTNGARPTCEDDPMTTVRGTIRSTNTITADGHADDQSTARTRAIARLGLTGYTQDWASPVTQWSRPTH